MAGEDDNHSPASAAATPAKTDEVSSPKMLKRESSDLIAEPEAKAIKI